MSGESDRRKEKEKKKKSLQNNNRSTRTAREEASKTVRASGVAGGALRGRVFPRGVRARVCGCERR